MSVLKPGRRYRVIASFTDYDGRVHPVGETWRFIQEAYLAYDDGLSLSIVTQGQGQTIRMQWRDDAQGPVLDHLHRYVQAVD